MTGAPAARLPRPSGWVPARADGYWRRQLADGTWLGVKPDRGGFGWVHMADTRAVPLAQCHGLSDAEAARASADTYVEGR